MVSKSNAILSVQKYLDKQNNRPYLHIFKIPVYKSLAKRIQLLIFKNYFKLKNGVKLDFPEWYIEPDSYVESKAHEIIVEEWSEDLGICWSIAYCTEQYYETKENRFGAIGGGPVFVDKETGIMYQTGSSPIDWLESFRKFKSGMKDENEFPSWKPIDLNV